MSVCHLDYETFSVADLPKVGAYRYAEDESTEILMCSYFIPGWPEVKLWVPAEGEPMPADLLAIFEDQDCLLVAWNAAFERAITRCCLPNLPVDVSRWRCAMVDAMAVGLPGKLEHAGPAAGLPAELFKQEGGRKLINKFCKPRKPTKKIPELRLTHKQAPEEWAQFKSYCRQDTVAECAIWEKLANWRLPPAEQRLWEIDQQINDHGIRVDLELVRAAHNMGLMHRANLVLEAQYITGLDNPNSVKQLVDWLNDQPDFDPEEDAEVENLRKKTVEKILDRDNIDDVVRQVLKLRQQIAKSSLKKYDVLLRATCDDGYIHGTMQFYGAMRTGRWAGRMLQVQNLPQGCIEDLDLLGHVRDLVRAENYAGLVFMFGIENIPAVLATLIRTCLIASPGNDLLAVDFSAIESVVTAWFADCTWRMDVFKTHGKIYEASASAAFKVPFEEFAAYKKATGKHHPLRKKGKVIELACGYGGGENAMINMGALEQGLTKEELKPMVEAWRDASPEIAGAKNERGYRVGGIWATLEKAAKTCLRTKQRQEAARCVFRFAGGKLVITLPSGRHLHYVSAKLERDAKGREQITYWGVDQKTKRWGKQTTWGGKLLENIVQAFSRDCLCELMLKLDARGYPQIMLVHDEDVMDIPKNFGSLDEVLGLMKEPIAWAPGLPLKGAGYRNEWYYKD